MRHASPHQGSALALIVLLLIAGPSAATNKFEETFDTTAFRDPVTTADWNTAGGSLRLFPFEVQLLDGFGPVGSFEDVQVVGDVAYVAALAGGVIILDVSDPEAITEITTFVPGSPIGLFVADDLLATAQRSQGVELWDVSDPANPVFLSSFEGGFDNLDVHIDGDILYVAAGVNGLRIHDISNPSAPVFLASLPFGRLRTLDLEGDLLVLVDEGASTMPVVDVSDPAAPVLMGTFTSLPNNAFDVDLDGSYAYLAAYENGVLAVDVSDPSNPTFTGGLSLPGLTLCVDVAGDRLHAAGSASTNTGQLAVLDLSNRGQPTLAAPIATYPGFDYRMDVVGDVAITAKRFFGASALRVNFANVPFSVASRSPGAFAIDVAVHGGRAYLGTSGTLEILDVSDVDNPVVLGGHPSFTGSIEVAGNTVYSADLTGSFEILDVENPAVPVVIGSFDKVGGGSALNMDLASGLTVLSYELTGLSILDISDPTTPTEIGTYASLDGYDSIRIRGERVYAASRATGNVVVFDLSNPTSPFPTATIPAGGATQLQIEGNLLYVGGQTGHELRIYDLSPATPVLLSTFDHPASNGVVGVEVVGSRVFLGDVSGNLLTVDASDPNDPVLEAFTPLAGTLSGGTDGRGLAVAGRHVFAALGNSGLQILQANQDTEDTGRNLAQSLTVDSTDATILRAQVVASATPGVSFEITADGGLNWQPIEDSFEWTTLQVPGSDLRWRSTHVYDGFRSVMSQISVSWLTEPASIESIVDVPNDQGGDVRVRINRSAYDFADEVSTPITGYQVYQLVENGAELLRAEANDPLAEESERALASFGDAVDIRGGRAFVDGERVASASFPAGTWEAVGWIAATQRDQYTLRVSTVADSSDAGTAWSTYFVTAHTTTPSTWYASAPASGYSTDDLAPLAPQNLNAAYDVGGVDLDWSDAPESDFRTHRVYRGTDPDFEPSPATLLDETTASTYRDETSVPWNAIYKVTTVDHAGNESDAASPNAVTAAEGPGPVRRLELGNATPNPFNPRTVIAFALPEAGPARLAVYDVSGRLVTTLVDAVQPAGRQEVVWDGTDSAGHAVASGVYLYRLDAQGVRETKRMVLVR